MRFLRSHSLFVSLVAALLGIGTLAAVWYWQQPATELNLAVCDPAHGPFSLTINNPFLPLPVGMMHVLESRSDKVQIRVLAQTELVAGIPTRVVEEREWNDGQLAEVSRNFFVQAPDGTVCNYGENVDEYRAGKIVGHAGAWRAEGGQNYPGIVMPAHPSVGQRYHQEIAPGVATDVAEHIDREKSYSTPAGIFHDVLLVIEKPPDTKRYARGIGLILDDDTQLTKY